MSLVSLLQLVRQQWRQVRRQAEKARPEIEEGKDGEREAEDEEIGWGGKEH